MRYASLVAVVAALSLFTSSCAKKQVPAAPPPPPPPPALNLVVLLPDPGGRQTTVTVTNPAGRQELTAAMTAVRVERGNVPPTSPFGIDETEVRRVFGVVLDTLPPPEQHFSLLFELNTNQLTQESLATLPAILQAIRDRRSTDISVTGHTDTTGSPDENYRQALQRAQSVAAYLGTQGVDPAIVSIESHGEADLAIKTADNVEEPKNRRVEVIVR